MEEINYDTLSNPQRSQKNFHPYCAVRGDMSVADGKLTYRNCLVIPSALRPDTLQHHQGITKCRQRANKISFVVRK